MEILDEGETNQGEKEVSPWLLLKGFCLSLLVCGIGYTFFNLLSPTDNFVKNEPSSLGYFPIGFLALWLVMTLGHICFLHISKFKKQNSFFVFLLGILLSLFSIYAFMVIITLFGGYSHYKFFAGLIKAEIMLVAALNFMNFIFCSFFMRWKWWWIPITIISIITILPFLLIWLDILSF